MELSDSRDQRRMCSEFAFVQLAQNFLREARRQRSDGQESVSGSCCKLESFHVLIRLGVMVLILTCNLCAKVFDQQSHDGNPLFLCVWLSGRAGLPNSEVSIANCES